MHESVQRAPTEPSEPSQRAAAPGPEAPPRLAVAYLTTEYPKVSHTFVRREIVELERRGHRVLRLAIRRGAAVDPADLAEAERTHAILESGTGRLLRAAAGALLARPRAFLAALRTTLAMSRRSERGFLRHIAYLVEACEVLRATGAAGVGHVHVHFGTNAAAVARLWRALGGGTYSMTVHGPDEFDACVALSLADKVAESAFTVAISSFGAAQLRRWVPPEHWAKIRIVRCTVGGQLAAAPAPIPAESRTLVSVGRLSAQKGQLVLLEAFAALVAGGADARLVLVGDGELRGVIERTIEATGASDRVQITGWCDEAGVQRELAAARALVLPSFAEGLPVVIMEAFAAGRPVVSTYVAGIPELVRPGENGWLVPAGDVPALVDALREVLATPTERLDAMGRAGRERVAERHDTRREVDVLERLLVDAARVRQ